MAYGFRCQLSYDIVNSVLTKARMNAHTGISVFQTSMVTTPKTNITAGSRFR